MNFYSQTFYSLKVKAPSKSFFFHESFLCFFVFLSSLIFMFQQTKSKKKKPEGSHPPHPTQKRLYKIWNHWKKSFSSFFFHIKQKILSHYFIAKLLKLLAMLCAKCSVLSLWVPKLIINTPKKKPSHQSSLCCQPKKHAGLKALLCPLADWKPGESPHRSKQL